MWLLFALLSGFFYTGLNLFQRHILKGNDSDPFAHSFFFSLVSMIVVAPFMLYNPQFATDLFSWLLVLVMGVFVAVQNFLSFSGTKFASLSIVGTIAKLRIIWVFLLGLLLAYEIWSPYKGLGILLTVIGGIIMVLRFNQKAEFKGILFAFFATFFYAAVIIIYTPLLQSFNVVTLTFLLFAVPTVINLFAMKNVVSRIQTSYKRESWKLIVVGFLSGLANLTIIAAINLGEASRVLVITEAFFILVLLGEHFILKEKTGVVRKSVAASFATIGAILMRIAP